MYKKYLSIVLTAFLLIELFALNTSYVQANGRYRIAFPNTLWEEEYMEIGVIDGNYDYKEAKIVSVSSSKPAILKIYKEKSDNEYVFWASGEKAGTYELTINYLDEGGNIQSLKKRGKVLKYPKHIKSLRVNGKKVNVKKKKLHYRYNVKKYKGTTPTVKLNLKKGWRITKIECLSLNISKKSGKVKSVKTIKVTKKMLEKGSKIKFSKKHECLQLSITARKGKGTPIIYNIDFNRPAEF